MEVRELAMPSSRTSAPALLIALASCTGSIGNANSLLDAAPVQSAAKMAAHAYFDSTGYPALQACTACHDSQPRPLFLAGAEVDDKYTTLLNYQPQVINLTAPDSSRILVKGEHSGAPALTPEQASQVLQWLQMEQQAAGLDSSVSGAQIIQTVPFTALLTPAGAATATTNTIPLDGAGLPGASISFTAEAIANGIYLSDLTLTGGPTGAHIVHPLFVSRPPDATPIPDDTDRFFDVDLDVAPNTSSTIDGGTAAFIGFNVLAPMTISFQTIEVYQPPTTGGGGTMSGCRAIASFMTNAAPALAAGGVGTCASCHGGSNAAAVAAVDMTNIGSTDPTMLADACKQVLLRVDTDDIANSGLLLAPRIGTTTQHPFKFASQTSDNAFEAAITTWATDEKDAP